MPIRRRDVLTAGALAAMARPARAAGGGMSLIVDPTDPVASSGPAQWAIGELRTALQACGIAVTQHALVADAQGQTGVLAGAGAGLIQPMLRTASAVPPVAPKALALARYAPARTGLRSDRPRRRCPPGRGARDSPRTTNLCSHSGQ